MSKAAGLLLLAGAGGAGWYFLIERPRIEAELAEQEAAYQASLAQAQRDRAPDFGDALKSSLINFGTEAILSGIAKGSTNGTGIGGFLSNLFGGGANNSFIPTSSRPVLRPAATPARDTSPVGGTANTASLRSLIGNLEAPQGYDQVWGGIRSSDQPPKRLTTMTVDEVLAWQDSIDSRYNSEAAGRYQVMEDTLRSLRNSGQVSGSQRFDRATQDRIADILMERRGLSSYRAGTLSETDFAQRLSQEWASLPAATRDARGRSATGQSYYAGDGLNKSSTKLDTVLAAIRRI